MALCLEALAFIFVPSSATRPSFSAPASKASRNTCSEELFQRWEVDLAEIREGAEVGLVASRQHSKRRAVFDQTLGDLARGTHPQAVAIEQQLHHQPRMIGRLTAPFFFIDALDGRQIQLIDHVADEVDEMAFRQPILQTGQAAAASAREGKPDRFYP